ncbi:MAG: flagellar biosynthesis anti-sigma factor FlgM [Betaproteobacteria bacterium]|nr:flagellar biosynthesis anti-sigma factor FlgM [Betaproteobacteria bacterium]
MKVEKSGKTPPVSPVRDGVGRAQSSRAPSSGADAASTQPPSSTSVHIGENAAQIQSLSESMAGSSVVNTAKVAEIKQAISEGRFQVNASAVADQLIASVTDLINSRPH